MLRATSLLLLSSRAVVGAGTHTAERGDAYRLLDGHYVGRVGCDHRGSLPLGMQRAGNLSLAECKAHCTATPVCKGFSYQRGGMHRSMRPPSTCLLKRKCTGRVDVRVICEPNGAAASAHSQPDCVARKSNVFNYMRVIPLEDAGLESGRDARYDEPEQPRAWSGWLEAMAGLRPQPARVAMLYLNLGAWPPWTRFILLAASMNRDVDFYFLGAPLDTSLCANCARLPFDLNSLRDRVRRYVLNASEVDQFGGKGNAARKLCDLVPMWPALFPELAGRHAFIGITEQDMLPGNLSSEFARLRDEDDMMLPLERFPQPLTDANFMVFRSSPKMLHAYRRVPGWENVIKSQKHARFDEWVVEPPSIMVAFQEMLLSSQLRVQPAQRFLVQDVVIIRKRRYPRIDDYGARVVFRWIRGSLLVERDGPCICPRDVVPIYGITCCLECFHNPGVVLPTQTHRRLEVLGFHFSAWKRAWGKWQAPTDVLPAVPVCPTGAVGFELMAAGFRCLEK